jgi:hypothetical protein
LIRLIWWMKYAGVFKDDPTFEQVQAYIEQYRCELDAEMEEYYRKLDAEEENMERAGMPIPQDEDSTR